MYLEPKGIEDYSYEKNGETVHSYQFIYERSFPNTKESYGNKIKKKEKGKK